MGDVGRISDHSAQQEQVAHMRDFIIHEANEKADEIRAKAEEDYNSEKQTLIEEEKLRLRKDYERRQKNIEQEARIENATQQNKFKLDILKAASSEMDDVFGEALKALEKIPGDAGKYSKLITELVEEGAVKIGQKEVKVRCRAADKAVVQKAISSCGGGIKATYDDTPFEVDKNVNKVDSKVAGGVMVTSMDGKITVSQSLNARLQIAYDTAFPIVKPLLFSQSGSKHVEKREAK